ncbi:protein kinase family protein [Nocardioides piscis]|uniref:Protein kinase n=1 Tax=Nocardioides piscis TaxID=2714938 RepID=A0A6G7YDN7_9ACTN|nr:protein kinase family protein [Nocardioides piscis]QIK74932.1 protein kinase [Nocardioides piscis]
MPESLRAGDVLAGRYRLDELLSESGSGRFWRAQDLVLQRCVAVHLIARSDDRAESLMTAARITAPHHDRRLLRVLDADQGDEVCYIVNEWGQGTSLDIMLANNGPLDPRRAAWVAAEVADSLARAHDAGLTHGRLVPENVLVDLNGQVRIIGFGVEAALHGLPAGRRSADLIDTVAVLYAGLTGKWAGMSTSAVPAAPTVQGQVLRPRQVRAGIPRPLDALCDEVLNTSPGAVPGPRATHDLSDLHGVVDALRTFVGDSSGLAGAEAWRSLHSSQALGAPAPDAEATQVVPEIAASSEPSSSEPPPAAPVMQDTPTQAGMPVFDDDGVGWIPTRTQAPPPPPPFEAEQAKPLFAPTPPDGTPVRRPRPGSATPPAAGYWPWESTGTSTGTSDSFDSGVWPAQETADADDEVPGRHWFQLAMFIGLGVLILVAAAAAFHLGSGGGEDGPEPPASTPTTPAPTAFVDLRATDFDPQGGEPREENPELVPLVLDGDPETSWTTSTYKQNFGRPTGLKDGVGLVVDVGRPVDVREVEVATLGGPTSVSIFVTSKPPTGVEGLTPVGTAAGNGGLTVTLDEAVPGRYVTVWLTSIPPVLDEYRGEVAEVSVKG